MTTVAYQQQPVLQHGATALPTSSPPKRDAKRKKYKIVLYGLGISEVVIGITCLILGIANLGYLSKIGSRGYYRHYLGFLHVSPSLWCTVPLIVTGVLGICTKKKASVCMYNANMALSVISSIMMGSLFACSILSTILTGTTGLIVIHSLLSFASFVAMVICIVHSAYCCAGVCCLGPSRAGQVVYIPAQAPAGQQYVQLANGQYMLVQPQPMMGSAGMQPGLVQQPQTYVYPSTSVSASQQAPTAVPEGQPWAAGYSGSEQAPAYAEKM